MVVGIYSRQSTDKQKSIPFQKELGEKFAVSKGWKFKHYSDKGVSGGAKIEDRKGFSKMLEDIIDGKIFKVWVWEQDRLEREPLTWYSFTTAIIDAGIDFYEDGKLIDLHDDNVFMLKGMYSLMNRSERKRSAKKSKAKINDLVSKGFVHGLIPYGYKRDKNKRMIIDLEESKIIKDIFNWSLDGIGYSSIANKLNDLEVPTSYNKHTNRKTTYEVDINRNNDLPEQMVTKNKSDVKWVGGTVKNILFRKTYIGIRTFGEQTIEVPPIIDESLFIKVHKAIKNRQNKSGKKTFHKYLLNNLVFCSRCGKRYTGREVTKHFYYRCASRIKKGASCGNPGVQRRILDELLISLVYGNLYEKVKGTLENTDNKEKVIIEEEIKELKATIKKETQLLLKAEDDYGDGIFSKEQYSRQHKRISIRKKDAEYNLQNQKELLSKYTDVKNVLQELEDTLVKPFLDNITYPFDTSKGNRIEDWIDVMFKARLGLKQPYEEQQKAVGRFVERIDIGHIKELKVTTITVKYKLPIEDEVYILDVYNLFIMKEENRFLVWVNAENWKGVSDKKREETENYLRNVSIDINPE